MGMQVQLQCPIDASHAFMGSPELDTRLGQMRLGTGVARHACPVPWWFMYVELFLRGGVCECGFIVTVAPSITPEPNI